MYACLLLELLIYNFVTQRCVFLLKQMVELAHKELKPINININNVYCAQKKNGKTVCPLKFDFL